MAMLAVRDGERVRLLSRRGVDWGDRLPASWGIEALAVRSWTNDSEATACDANARD